jgi:plastocyanin
MTHTTHLAAIAVLACAITAISAACGGSSPSTGPSTGGACTAGPTSTTITISNNAVCPQNITVPRGTQVTFVNSDSRNHTMNSDPHPEHTDCPEINQVGFLTAGQSRQTGNLNIARRCGFHDHEDFNNAALKGSITIQ